MSLKISLVIAVIIIIIMAFFAGVYVGGDIAVKKCAKIASMFIKVDYDAVNDAIFRYENRIENCYNAYRFNDTGN